MRTTLLYSSQFALALSRCRYILSAMQISARPWQKSRALQRLRTRRGCQDSPGHMNDAHSHPHPLEQSSYMGRHGAKTVLVKRIRASGLFGRLFPRWAMMRCASLFSRFITVYVVYAQKEKKTPTPLREQDLRCMSTYIWSKPPTES